jgi:phage terminase large subunit
MPNDATFHFNKVYKPVFTTKARYIFCWGGRGRGGSHFGTDYFLYKMTQPEYFRGVIMRSVYSDIKDSLYQDWKDRLESSDFPEEDFTITDSKKSAIYKPTGNGFIAKGFKKSSGSQSAKLKSLAGITHIIIEEAEEVDEEDFNKLDDSIRTNKIENIQIILLFNPPNKNHWLMKRFFNLEDCGLLDEKNKPLPYYKAIPKAIPELLAIHSTYQDNIKNLNEKTISKYRGYGDPDNNFYNPEKYYVDVCGLVPEGARGRIYRNWKVISSAFFDSLPYPSFYGLDFGYSDDPVALVEIKSHNNRNFYREIVYEPGLTNPALASLMKVRGVNKKAPIYADSGEPKSIKELRDLGFNVLPADKGPDSVLFGIKQISAMENYVTQESEHIWFENQEYKWMLDANKEPTDTPRDKHNHAKDGIRYGVTMHRNMKRKRKVVVGSGTTIEPAKKKNPLEWV